MKWVKGLETLDRWPFWAVVMVADCSLIGGHLGTVCDVALTLFIVIALMLSIYGIFQANVHGVGVIGVIEADFLTPIHNKQDFNKTDK